MNAKTQKPFVGFDPSKLFGDPFKVFEQFKLPGIDFKALMEINQRDFAALNEAQQIALAGMRSAPGDMQAQMTEMFGRVGELLKTATSIPGSGGENAAKLVSDSMSKMFGDMRELAESAQKSQVEAWGLLVKRAQTRLQELTDLMAAR